MTEGFDIEAAEEFAANMYKAANGIGAHTLCFLLSNACQRIRELEAAIHRTRTTHNEAHEWLGGEAIKLSDRAEKAEQRIAKLREALAEDEKCL